MFPNWSTITRCRVTKNCMATAHTVWVLNPSWEAWLTWSAGFRYPILGYHVCNATADVCQNQRKKRPARAAEYLSVRMREKELVNLQKYRTKGNLERLAYLENEQTSGKSPALKRPNRRINDRSNADYFSSHSARKACSLKDRLIFRKRIKGLLVRRTKLQTVRAGNSWFGLVWPARKINDPRVNLLLLERYTLYEASC